MQLDDTSNETAFTYLLNRDSSLVFIWRLAPIKVVKRSSWRRSCSPPADRNALTLHSALNNREAPFHKWVDLNPGGPNLLSFLIARNQEGRERIMILLI